MLARGCGINQLYTPSLRGVKRRSNPTSSNGDMDCFAPLVMTKGAVIARHLPADTPQLAALAGRAILSAPMHRRGIARARASRGLSGRYRARGVSQERNYSNRE